MPIEVTLVKGQDGALRPASAADQEHMGKFKTGQAVRVSVTQIKSRSLQHLRLYWSGLIELAMDYWEPTGGLVSLSERSTLKRFADWLDKQGGNSGAIRRACAAFLDELRHSRGLRIDAPHKSREALHEWIKIEAGYFEYAMTPNGVTKRALSINFNVMDQSQFNDFYKAAFNVCWRFILSRTFENEDQADSAINQLLAFG